MDTYSLQAALQKHQDEKDQLLKIQAELLKDVQELSDRLREAERFKSDFLSNVRNQINNPLMAIIGLSRNIKNSTQLSQKRIQKWGDLISTEAVNLDFQLKNIFAAAEIEAGAATPQLTLVDIDQLIHNQIGYLSSKAVEYNVAPVYHSMHLRPFKTDAAMLQLIVINLLANAIEFSPAGASVDIKCQILNDELIFVIEDRGIGIDSPDINTIFDRFKQLDAGSTKAHRGYGLGLSIVKEFTEALYGHIEIESKVNDFTRVTVSLPEFHAGQTQGFSLGGEEVLFGEEEAL